MSAGGPGESVFQKAPVFKVRLSKLDHLTIYTQRKAWQFLTALCCKKLKIISDWAGGGSGDPLY
jgi:hypothetical protein